MTERFWENVVQGLGKAVLKSHNNGETAVNGYSPAQFLILSVSCHVLQSWFFTYNTISFEDFTFFCVLLPLKPRSQVWVWFIEIGPLFLCSRK